MSLYKRHKIEAVDFCLSAGLFEVRAQEYLETLPSGEQSGVNRFLKGLGKEPAKPLASQEGWASRLTGPVTVCGIQCLAMYSCAGTLLALALVSHFLEAGGEPKIGP